MADQDMEEVPVGSGLIGSAQNTVNMHRDHLTKPGMVESTSEVFYNPISPLNESNSIEFNVPPMGLNYIDLESVRLHGRLKIVKVNQNNEEVPLTTTTTIPAQGGQEAKTTTTDDDVSFVNLLPASCFKLVSVSLNSTEVQEHSTFFYSYKTLIETLFSFSKQHKDTFLEKSCLYIPDKPGTEAVNNKNTAGTGYLKRARLLKKNKELEFITPIHCDLFMSGMMLIPGVSMRVKLFRNQDQFTIMAPTNNNTYKIKFLDLSLSLKSMSLRNDITEKHSLRLLRQPITYNFRQGRVTTHTISPDTNSTFIQNIASGILPDLVVVGLVDSDSMAGSYDSNPYR